MTYFNSFLLRDIEAYVESKVFSDISLINLESSLNESDSRKPLEIKRKKSQKDHFKDAKKIYKQIDGQTNTDGMYCIFEILISRKDEFEKCIELLETEDNTEPAITIYQCYRRIEYYDEVIKHLANRFSFSLPQDYALKLESK